MWEGLTQSSPDGKIGAESGLVSLYCSERLGTKGLLASCSRHAESVEVGWVFRIPLSYIKSEHQNHIYLEHSRNRNMQPSCAENLDDFRWCRNPQI